MDTLDYLGNPLSVGDVVVIMRPKYRDLCLAKIDKISTSGKTLFLKYRVSWTSSYHIDDLKQVSSQVIKYFGDATTWDKR